MKSRAFLLADVGCVALGAAAASAVQICPDCLHFIHTWPADGAPCSAGQTLQACIDGARSGDIVQIATDRPIAESISIAQSLTLQAFGGALPAALVTFFDVHGMAAAEIDAGEVGAPGGATVHFPYLVSAFKMPGPMGTNLLPTIRTVTGLAKLTGQSFQITEDSRTAAGGGHIQLVAPFSFTASPISTWSPSSSVTLALDFAPEPDRLAVGAITIAVLCAVGVAKRRDA